MQPIGTESPSHLVFLACMLAGGMAVPTTPGTNTAICPLALAESLVKDEPHCCNYTYAT
jgi:hypothetical protein